MSDELKPCPFCGKLLILKDSRGGAWIGHNKEVMYGCSFVCNSCGTEVRINGKAKYDEANNDAVIYKAAAEKWNTRPVEDELRRQLAEAQAAGRGGSRCATGRT